ncbi:Guanine nucleotide exchange factor VAV2 [Lamellibrachia satsuma]|nr:Guanine nucleotide exchange factor VAV2 [Lamellibrachia satsuma]
MAGVLKEDWRVCADWLVRCQILAPEHKVTSPTAQVFDLAQVLRDGVLICHLLNRLYPGAIDAKEFSQRPQMSQFLCVKNIRMFLTTCKRIFAMKTADLFDNYDLFDVRDFGKPACKACLTLPLARDTGSAYPCPRPTPATLVLSALGPRPRQWLCLPLPSAHACDTGSVYPCPRLRQWLCLPLPSAHACDTGSVYPCPQPTPATLALSSLALSPRLRQWLCPPLPSAHACDTGSVYPCPQPTPVTMALSSLALSPRLRHWLCLPLPSAHACDTGSVYLCPRPRHWLCLPLPSALDIGSVFPCPQPTSATMVLSTLALSPRLRHWLCLPLPTPPTMALPTLVLGPRPRQWLCLPLSSAHACGTGSATLALGPCLRHWLCLPLPSAHARDNGSVYPCPQPTPATLALSTLALSPRLRQWLCLPLPSAHARYNGSAYPCPRPTPATMALSTLSPRLRHWLCLPLPSAHARDCSAYPCPRPTPATLALPTLALGPRLRHWLCLPLPSAHACDTGSAYPCPRPTPATMALPTLALSPRLRQWLCLPLPSAHACDTGSAYPCPQPTPATMALPTLALSPRPRLLCLPLPSAHACDTGSAYPCPRPTPATLALPTLALGPRPRQWLCLPLPSAHARDNGSAYPCLAHACDNGSAYPCPRPMPATLALPTLALSPRPRQWLCLPLPSAHNLAYEHVLHVINTLSKLSNSPLAQNSGIKGFMTLEAAAHRNSDYRALEEIAAEKEVGDCDDLYDFVGHEDDDEDIYDDLMTVRSRSSVSELAEPKCKRDYCIKELVETEKNYVEALNMIVKHFIRPLVKVLTSAQHQTIFMHIEELFKIHTGFQSDLTRACNPNSASKITIASCFIKWKEKFLIYGEFCSNLPEAQDLVDEVCKKDQSVEQTIMQCQTNANDGKFRLRDLLSVPMQRILKYHLLLRELIRQTDSSNPERINLDQALLEMEDLSLYINEVKRDNEALQLITEIQERLWPPSQGWRELKVRPHEEKGRREKPRYLFLFDKVMMICKPRDMLTDNRCRDMLTDNRCRDMLTDNRCPDMLTDNRCWDMLTDNRCRDMLTDNRCRDMLTDNRCTDMLTDNRCRDMLTDNRCPDMLTDNRCRDMLTDNRCRDMLTDNRCPDMLTDNRCRDMLTDNRCPDMLTDNRCRDMLTDNRCPDMLTDNRCPDMLTDNRCRDMLTDNRCRDMLTDNRCRDMLTDNFTGAGTCLLTTLRTVDRLFWGESYSYRSALVLSMYTVDESQKTKDRLYQFMLVKKDRSEVYSFYAKTEDVRRKWIEAINLALSNTSPEGARDASHDFVMHSFDKPTVCDYCKKLLRGVFYQGYQCTITNMKVHKECIIKAKNKTGPKLPQRQQQGFVQPLPPRNPIPHSRPAIGKGKAAYSFQGTTKPDDGRPILKFNTGDVIDLLSTEDPHWWEGRMRGEQGFFPAKYVNPHRDITKREPYVAAKQLLPHSSESTPAQCPAAGVNLDLSNYSCVLFTQRKPSYLESDHTPAGPPLTPGIQRPMSCVNVDLSNYPWFLDKLPRTTATTKLDQCMSGTYLVREGNRDMTKYAISIKYHTNVKHIRIQVNAENQFYIADCKMFRSLPELVQYYQENSLEINFPGLCTTLLIPYKEAVEKLKATGKMGHEIIGYCTALYDYSANQPSQLSLKEGDRVAIISKAGGDRGWWRGQIDDKNGFFPKSYVEEDSDAMPF